MSALIAGLAHGRGTWHADFGKLLNSLLHQGTCYPASAPALTYFPRLLTCGALPAPKRRDIYLALLWAAGLYREDLIDLAEYAAASPACDTTPWPSEVTSRFFDHPVMCTFEVLLELVLIRASALLSSQFRGAFYGRRAGQLSVPDE